MKTPKHQKNVSSSKKPKQYQVPSSSSNQPIAWHLSTIDNESKWGTAIFYAKNVFSVELAVTEEVNWDNNLTDALFKLDLETFSSIEHFMEKLQNEYTGLISIEDFRKIIQGLKKIRLWEDELSEKIKHFENQSWDNIVREVYGHRSKTKHHYISVNQLSEDAQKRLKELKLDDIENVFSIRLTGKFRIFGIRTGQVFKVLWFDPNHEVCEANYN